MLRQTCLNPAPQTFVNNSTSRHRKNRHYSSSDREKCSDSDTNRIHTGRLDSVPEKLRENPEVFASENCIVTSCDHPILGQSSTSRKRGIDSCQRRENLVSTSVPLWNTRDLSNGLQSEASRSSILDWRSQICDPSFGGEFQFSHQATAPRSWS